MKLVINVSSAQLLADCQMRWFHRYKRRLVPEDDRSEALRFGTAIHASLAAYYKYAREDGPQEAVERTVAAFEESYGEELSQDMLDYGKRMMRAYCQKYANDFELFKEIRFVEAPLVRRLTPPDAVPDWYVVDELYLVGRPDLYVHTDLGGGTWWHVQHKTAGHTVSFDRYVRQYDMSWHERAYRLLAQGAGVESNGTILNVLRKTKRIHVEGGHTFQRFYVPIDDTAVNNFVYDLFAVANTIVEGPLTHNPSACMRYNRLCPYLELCLGLPIEDSFATAEPTYVDIAQQYLDEHDSLTQEELTRLLEQHDML